MKHEVIVGFKVVGINSKQAREIIENQLNKETMKLDEWEIINYEESNEYKVYDMFFKFFVETVDRKEAEEIVTCEMEKDTMKLRLYKVNRLEVEEE